MIDDIIVEQQAGSTFFEVRKDAKTDYATHGYFRYIGKFPPQIPRYIIRQYSSPGDLVYDPMCGGGTSLVEAVLAGRKAMGSDINDVALLVSRVVSNPINPALLEPGLDLLLRSIAAHSGSPDKSLQGYGQGQEPTLEPKDVESGFLGTDKYYSSNALSAIEIIYGCVKALENETTKEFALVALLAILRKISNANNKKINVVIDPKAKVYSPYETYFEQIDFMIRANRSFFRNNAEPVKVFKASSTDTGLDRALCDLVVVHPPYPTNTAFSEQLMLQLALLGIDHKSVWQDELAVRGSYMHKKDGVRYYLVGWFRTMKEIYRILRKGGHCGIVIGDGQIDFVRLPMGALTVEFAKDIGFELVQSMTHRINNTTGWTLNRRMKQDYIVVLRK